MELKEKVSFTYPEGFNEATSWLEKYDFLDSKEGEVTLPGLLMGSFDEDDDVQKRTDLIGITFPGCDDAESIEVELLSCVRY